MVAHELQQQGAGKIMLSHCAEPPATTAESATALEHSWNTLHVLRDPVDVVLSLYATTATKPMWPDPDIWAWGMNKSVYPLHTPEHRKKLIEVVPTAWMRQHLRNMARDCTRMNRTASTVARLEAWALRAATALVDYGPGVLWAADIFDLAGHMQRWDAWLGAIEENRTNSAPEGAEVKYEHLADGDVAAALGDFMGLRGPYHPAPANRTYAPNQKQVPRAGSVRYSSSSASAGDGRGPTQQYDPALIAKRAARLSQYVGQSQNAQQAFLNAFASTTSWYDRLPRFRQWGASMRILV